MGHELVDAYRLNRPGISPRLFNYAVKKTLQARWRVEALGAEYCLLILTASAVTMPFRLSTACAAAQSIVEPVTVLLMFSAAYAAAVGLLCQNPWSNSIITRCFP